MPSTNRACEQSGSARRCPDFGRDEFCGYCAEHWRLMSPRSRSLLRKSYVPDPPAPPPPAPVVVRQEVLPVIERVRTVYPARTRLAWFALWCWRGGLTGAVAALLVERLRHGGGR